jgi:indole-3-glycerol phosphate synthase
MILDEILAYKRMEIENLKQQPGAHTPPPLPSTPRRDFPAALRAPGIQVIAEIKRRSPSKGNICLDLDPAQFARTYQAAGAAAISVLCDEHFFGGSLTDMYAARDAVALPILRKDFILDEVQIWQSVGEPGPDAILLIVAALSPARLRALLAEAHRYGLACLVETHTAAEVDIALAAGAQIIGINNRDLQTFTVDLATTERLRPLIPADRIVVSESGIHSRDDVERLAAIGVDAVLVGESLLSSNNSAAKLGELLGK